MSSTTSRWISRSWLKASASWARSHGALDGVLDGDEAEVDLAGLDRPQHVGDRGQVDELGGGQVGLA